MSPLPRPPASVSPEWPGAAAMPILARQTIAAAATVDSYWWAIHLPVRYAYKEGMAGSDIAALQLNLMRLGYDLTVDGDKLRGLIEPCGESAGGWRHDEPEFGRGGGHVRGEQ